MYKSLKFIFQLLFFTFIAGCGGGAFENEKSINFLVDAEAYNSFNLSQIVDTLLVIPLETRENALIGSISKVVTTEDYIFVLDRSFAESLFIFDWQGKLVKVFTGTGEGPMEFLRVTNFFLNEKNGSILIFDGSLGKIIELSLEGNFIFEIKNNPKLWIYDLFPITDGFFSLKTKDDKSGKYIDFIDDKLKFKRILVDLNDKVNVVGGQKMRHFFAGSENEIYFKQMLSNVLYELGPSGDIVRKINFSFGNRNWTPAENPIHSRDAYMVIRNQNQLALSDEFLDFDNYLLFNFWDGGHLKSGVFVKENSASFSLSGINNDVDELFPHFPGVLPLNSNPNQFVVDIHPQDLISQINSKGSNLKYSKVFENLRVDVNDNPVLLIYKKK